uniref:Uncharacterized protein n=1 Tax=Anguilla anguilla TaxID=7936 RepID=A0A0E9WB55_ANGAN
MTVSPPVLTAEHYAPLHVVHMESALLVSIETSGFKCGIQQPLALDQW